MIVIVGPTGVGKSNLAIHLSQKIDGEIINADSRQIYTDMNIGTAKPNNQELSLVPHHLFSIINPDQDFSVYDFSQMAESTIIDINLKGRVPILVGGTGQYIWSLLENWEHPKGTADFSLRESLEKRLEKEGLQSLLDELNSKDSSTLLEIDVKNPRRVIRALERINLGYKGHTAREKCASLRDGCILIGLTSDRNALYKKVDERVDTMFEKGWVEEVKTLKLGGYQKDLSSMSGIGYQEINLLLESPNMSIEECKRAICSRTHKLIRSQYNWFKLKDSRINWFDIGLCSEEYIVDEIISRYNQI
jgi:tRNA dimethylallyltransferase